jgi:hypothetical protein
MADSVIGRSGAGRVKTNIGAPRKRSLIAYDH